MVLGVETTVFLFEYWDRRLARVLMFKLSSFYRPLSSTVLLKKGLILIEDESMWLIAVLYI